MKKTILILAFLVSAITFTSCSSDDDSPAQDPIIGKWKVTKVEKNGVERELSCNDEGITEFKSDGTYTTEDYEGDDSGNCQLSNTLKGTWEKLSANNYNLKLDNSNIEDVVTLNGNTFSLTDVNGDDTWVTTFTKQ